MVKDARPGLGGEESQPQNKVNVKWPKDYLERLDQTWRPHVLPVLETTSRWEQVTPIPTFHKRETSFDGKTSIHQLWYLFQSNRLGVNTCGRTIEEAEAEMRRSLPFDIEIGKGMIPNMTPTIPLIEASNEISQYFRQKPEEPKK